MLWLFVEQFHVATHAFMVYEAQGVAVEQGTIVGIEEFLWILPLLQHFPGRDGCPGDASYVAGKTHAFSRISTDGTTPSVVKVNLKHMEFTNLMERRC